MINWKSIKNYKLNNNCLNKLIVKGNKKGEVQVVKVDRIREALQAAEENTPKLI